MIYGFVLSPDRVCMCVYIYVFTQQVLKFHIKLLIQAKPYQMVLSFILFLILMQLLDNANRSQAKMIWQDNGAFIAAWLTWL